ncbi:MAG: PAS domain S-box protein [Alphaproteobacteria bacterium]|nr:MAG: PAS domain S-box protein [Alphaproteobacteria bacterium]
MIVAIEIAIPLTLLAVIGLLVRHRKRLGAARAPFRLLVSGLALLVCGTSLFTLQLLAVDQFAWSSASAQPVSRSISVAGLVLVAISLGGWLPTLLSTSDIARRASAIDRIVRAIGRTSGEALYRSLTAAIAEELQADRVFVGRLSPDGTSVHALVVHGSEGPAASFRYRLAGSPCAGVLSGEETVFIDRVAELFPDDPPLRHRRIRGYAANGIIGRDGKAMGILVALTKHRLTDAELAASIMRVFSDRVAVEFEREATIADLAASRDQLLEAQSLAKIGYWRSLSGETSVWWSPEVFAMTGLPPAESVDLADFLALLGPEDREHYQRQRAVAFGQGARFEVDVRLIRPDGQERWLVIIGKPVPGASVGSYHGLVQDITARKQHEHELLDAYAAKTQFVALLSHELRSPLNPILGFATLLAGESAERFTAKARRDHAQEIVNAAELMIRLVDDILDLADVEVNAVALDLAATDLADLIRLVTNRTRGQATEAGLTIATDLPTGPVSVRIDRRRIKQILFNLISNAIKFTPAGGRIAVGLSTVGRDIAVTVTDTGVGMTAEQIQRLLQPFRQGDERLGRTVSGLGLGLAISKALAEAHGGHLAIDSTPGQGTTVALHLPRSAAIGG